MGSVNSPINGSAWTRIDAAGNPAGIMPRAPMPRRQRRRLFLKEWRQFRTLSQERLADRSGVSQGMISLLENGKTDFTGAVLEQLADALMCEPADLLMRNPLDEDAVWSITDNLRKADPDELQTARRLLDALLKTGTNN